MGISKGYVFDGWSCPFILPGLPAKANILIDNIGHARLIDFGLLAITQDSTNHSSSGSYTQGGTARWMSPELINPQQFGFKTSRPTKSSDCYALGMAIYETISGRLPFHKHTDLSVLIMVLKGERPLREVGFADNLWEILEQCWMPQPNTRPSIKDVLQGLERASQSWEPPSPGVYQEMEWDDGSLDSATNSPGMFFFHFFPLQQFMVLVCSVYLQHLHPHTPSVHTKLMNLPDF